MFLSLTFSKVLETWFNRTSHCLSFDAASSTPPARKMLGCRATVSRVPGIYHSPAMSSPDRNKKLKELHPESKKTCVPVCPKVVSNCQLCRAVEPTRYENSRDPQFVGKLRSILTVTLLQTRSSRGRKVCSVLCPAIVSSNPSSNDAKLCARVPECSSLCACGLATRTGLSYKGPHTHMDNSSLLFLPKVCKSPNFRNS